MQAEATTLVRVIRLIDAISAWSGRIVAWLIIPLIAVMTWEICVRYLQLVGLALVMGFPQLVLWLPGVLYTR